MKITIWIRANENGDNDKITLRTDHKPESYDTPTDRQKTKKHAAKKIKNILFSALTTETKI